MMNMHSKKRTGLPFAWSRLFLLHTTFVKQKWSSNMKRIVIVWCSLVGIAETATSTSQTAATQYSQAIVIFSFQLLVWRQQIAQEIVNHWSSGTCPLKVSQKVKLRWHVKFSFHPEISPKRQSTLSTFGLRVSCVFNHLFLFVWLVGRSKYAYIKLICGIQLHHWLVAWVFISL